MTELKVLIDRRLQYSVNEGLGLAAMTSQDIQDRRFEVAELLIAGHDPTEVSEKYKVSKDTLLDWVLWYLLAYYPPVDPEPDFDDEYAQLRVDLHEDADLLAADRKRRSIGGKRGPASKRARSERLYRPLIDIELGKNRDVLEDPDLPERLMTSVRQFLEEGEKPPLGFDSIKDFVKTLHRFQTILDEELDRDSDALEDPQLSQRLYNKMQKFPKRQRRQQDWIEAMLEVPRLCQRLLTEELAKDSNVLDDPELPNRLYDKMTTEVAEINWRELPWFKAYVQKLRPLAS